MNKVKVFDSISSLKDIKLAPYMGIVYAIQYNNNTVKIGQTQSPYNRILTQTSQMNNYAGIKAEKIAISIEHTNYRANEKELHKLFEPCRIAQTELFSAPFSSIIDYMELGLTYLDESKKKVTEAREFAEKISKALFPNLEYNDSTETEEDTSNIIDMCAIHRTFENPIFDTTPDNIQESVGIVDGETIIAGIIANSLEFKPYSPQWYDVAELISTYEPTAKYHKLTITKYWKIE